MHKAETDAQGFKGSTGSQGPPGRGGAGSQGPKNGKEDTGALGPEGDTGPQGPKGDKEDTGPQGLRVIKMTLVLEVEKVIEGVVFLARGQYILNMRSYALFYTCPFESKT